MRYYISTIGTYPNKEPFALITDSQTRDVIYTGTLSECMIELYTINKKLVGIDKHKQKLKDLNKLYISKNQDYGDSFGLSIKKYGDVAYFVRAEDKLNRLESLLFGKNKQQVKDESIQDTLDDLLNYTIMYGMELLGDTKHFDKYDNAELHDYISQAIANNYEKMDEKASINARFAYVNYSLYELYQNRKDRNLLSVIKLAVHILHIMDKV